MTASGVEVGTAHVTVVAPAKGAVRQIEREFGAQMPRIGQRAAARMGGGFGASLKKIMSRTGLAAGLVIGETLRRGFGRLSAIEDARASLTGLGKDTRTVDTIMTNALASVKGTAFGLDEAAKVAATTVAAGIEPGKKLTGTLKLVADAATIGKTSMADMGDIFSKVAASNKVQGDTINQLNQRGIPILQFLGQTMHKSQGEVSALASKGKIDFATFAKAMKEGLGGAALASGNTASGAFKNMFAAISRVGASLLSGIFPQIGNGFRSMITFLDDITPAAKRFGENVGTALQSVVSAIQLFINHFRGVTSVVGEMPRTWMRPILDASNAFRGFVDVMSNFFGFLLAHRTVVGSVAVALGTMFAAFKIGMGIMRAFAAVQAVVNVVMAANPIGIVVLALAGLVAGLIFAWKNSQTFRTVVLTVWAAIKTAVLAVVNWFATSVPAAFNAVKNFLIGVWTAIRVAVTSAWLAIKNAVAVGVKFVGTVLRTALNIWLLPIRIVMTAIGTVIVLAWMAIRAIFRIALSFIKDRIVTPIWNAIGGRFMAAMALIRRGFELWWAGLRLIASTVFNAIRAVVSAVWDRIRANFSAVFAVIRAAWNAWWSALRLVASTIFNAIHAVVSAVWGRIRGAWNTAQGAVKAIWSAFWGAIKKTGGDAIDAVKSKIDTVLGKIKGAFQTAKDNIRTIWDGVKNTVSAPIVWIKDNVYNRPLVPVWNKVADLVNGPHLTAYKEGGKVSGPREGRDNVLGVTGAGIPIARVEPGEWVAPRWMSPLFPWLEDVRQSGQLPGYAGGGVINWIKSKITAGGAYVANLSDKLKNWVLGGLHTAASALLRPVRDAITNSLRGSGVGETVGRIGNKAIDLILDKIKSSEDAASTIAGGQISIAGAGTGSRRLVSWHGGTFTDRFRNTLNNAQRFAGTYIPVWQGGFSRSVAASGTSHYGDAIDTLWKMSILSGLRRAGVAAWHRTPAQGFVHHIHGVPLPGFGYPGGQGIWQAQDYLRGGDGLHLGGLVKRFRGYAAGTRSAAPGWAVVGERQPELVRFGGGEQVTPLSDLAGFRQQNNYYGNFGWDPEEIAKANARRGRDMLAAAGSRYR